MSYCTQYYIEIRFGVQHNTYKLKIEHSYESINGVPISENIVFQRWNKWVATSIIFPFKCIIFFSLVNT